MIAQSLQGQGQARVRIALALLALAAVPAVVLTSALPPGARALLFLLPILIAVAAAVWARPLLATLLIVGCAGVIEQLPTETGDLTDTVQLFASFTDLGLSGFFFTPFELLLGAVLLIVLLRQAAEGRIRLPRSRLALAVGALALLVAIGELVGMARGGDFKMSIWELRPWVYLFAAYLLTALVVRGPRAVEAVLWVFVLGVGLKGLQGTWQTLALLGAASRPESILAHEEAFAFGVFTALVAGLWVFGHGGPLRVTATALLPFVMIANLANERRTSWLILGACLAALALMAWVRLPRRRHQIAVTAVAVMVGAGLYLLAFWNDSGLLGQPARAVASAVAPNPRDNASNAYRRAEDANLALNIRRTAPLGAGFGVPIDYALPIADISKNAPLIKFIPHDGLLHVWLRMGLAGAAAFWVLVGVAILAGWRLLRCPEPLLALFGALVVCVLIAYIIEGGYDLGLWWFRVALVVGCVLGCADALLHPGPAARPAGARR